jgi:Mimiviridae putative ATP-dependent DNA helicase
MTQLTSEQAAYINFDKHVDTKLIATAGSGKTFTIIQKMKHMIEDNIIKPKEMLMLTFSRFTRDDFLNRIKKYDITCINENYIKTIDSFAKSIIDPNNEVDISILSYKFMKYLEDTSSKEIKKNKNIKNIKSIFVDEAQDLNETQYKILCYLKEKNDTVINLIGDPNQNIYQFRGSSDKYLTNFKAKTFYLTYNFRSHQEVVNFSKHLRPEQNIDVMCKLGKINRLPVSVFYNNEDDLETNLVGLIKRATSTEIDLSDFAILSPTRGRMRSNGKSNGLCLISNILYKNGIKFKQFYEEATEELSNNIQYAPEKGHINILTYMGSKGLEWKYTIIIDAETCLINKRHFTHEKHKFDQYLLYVACSRAINNLFVFSKCYFNKKQDKHIFQFNPWFSLIPTKFYIRDERYNKQFEFPEIEEKTISVEEKKISKILDQCPEKNLYELAILCDYGVEGHKSIKEVVNMYQIDKTENNYTGIFMSKFIKELFFAYYNISNDLPPKKYHDIECIINLDIIMKNLSKKFLDWYWKNRGDLSWEKYDNEKKSYDKEIVEIIEKYFDRTKDLSEYIIVPDCYFKSFILSNLKSIKQTYDNYLKCKNIVDVRKYLFIIIVYIYSLETQHYYHVKNNGKRFEYILSDYESLFNQIYLFIQKKNILIDKINAPIENNKYKLSGNIDFIDDDDEIYEIKCSNDVTLKHIVQQIVYYVLYNKLYDHPKKSHKIKLHFINLITGNITNIKITLKKEDILKIINIFVKNKTSN